MARWKQRYNDGPSPPPLLDTNSCSWENADVQKKEGGIVPDND